MNFVESSIVMPILIGIITIILFTTINLYVNLYHDAKDKHAETLIMYEDGKEDLIRLRDMLYDK